MPYYNLTFSFFLFASFLLLLSVLIFGYSLICQIELRIPEIHWVLVWGLDRLLFCCDPPSCLVTSGVFSGFHVLSLGLFSLSAQFT